MQCHSSERTGNTPTCTPPLNVPKLLQEAGQPPFGLEAGAVGPVGLGKVLEVGEDGEDAGEPEGGAAACPAVLDMMPQGRDVDLLNLLDPPAVEEQCEF